MEPINTYTHTQVRKVNEIGRAGEREKPVQTMNTRPLFIVYALKFALTMAQF